MSKTAGATLWGEPPPKREAVSAPAGTGDAREDPSHLDLSKLPERKPDDRDAWAEKVVGVLNKVDSGLKAFGVDQQKMILSEKDTPSGSPFRFQRADFTFPPP